MWKRILGAIAVLVLGACSGDSPAKDVAADVTIGNDGPARDWPVINPDGPGREAQAGDRSLGDQPASKEGGTIDQSKPDASAPFCTANNTTLRCDCYGFSKKQNKFIKLWGKGNQVTIAPDFKVRVVNMLGQLKVKQVASLPIKCGDWQTVTALGDFTYQLVTIPGQEDFTIQYDQNFPGVNKAGCPNCP